MQLKQKNQQGLQAILAIGARVFYADHHQSGDIPQHSQLTAHIDLDANMCTGLIIDKWLAKRYHTWAITAAYGDNLIKAGIYNKSELESKAEVLKQNYVNTVLKEIETFLIILNN
mgnify:CR=1 FL=1